MWATLPVVAATGVELIRLSRKAPGRAKLIMAAPEECKSCYRRT